MNAARGVWAAGIGCRRGCPARTLRALLDEALTACGLAATDLGWIASIDTKGDEDGLATLAAELGVALSLWPADVLRRFDGQLHTRSTRVRAATGVDSVAEAAALAAVSHGEPGDTCARLVLPRRGDGLATVAIACRVDDGMA